MRRERWLVREASNSQGGEQSTTQATGDQERNRVRPQTARQLLRRPTLA